jgi:hypothetical protein
MSTIGGDHSCLFLSPKESERPTQSALLTHSRLSNFSRVPGGAEQELVFVCPPLTASRSLSLSQQTRFPAGAPKRSCKCLRQNANLLRDEHSTRLHQEPRSHLPYKRFFRMRQVTDMDFLSAARDSSPFALTGRLTTRSPAYSESNRRPALFLISNNSDRQSSHWTQPPT